MQNKTGADIKIRKTQIRKAVQQEGSLWSSLFKLLPMAAKAVGPLATGALSGLANVGVNKIFGRGQVGGFLIPQNKINQLIKYKDWLTEAQKKQIVNAIHTGGQIVIKPTKAQSGGFLGTLLASIGIPMVLNALMGKGLQVDRSRSRRMVPVFVPNTTKKDGGLVLPVNYRPPPFFGTWDQYGKGKKQKRKRSVVRRKQSIQGDSINRRHSVKFINKPLSNFDIIVWVKKIKIKHFRGIYSGDNLPQKMKKDEVGIINLDSQIGPGTHWVAYRNGDKYAEYFDSFGLIMPKEIMQFMSTSGKRLMYSGNEIQERDSVLCGYWCLYYLFERQKVTSILKTIHNAHFDMIDQSVKYFQKLSNQ